MGITEWYEGLHMDYDGQAKAEKVSRFIILIFGVVGFAWGYYLQQFSATVHILGAGFILAALLTIPPWPIYKKKPLNWQKARARTSETDPSESKEKKKKK